MSDVAITIGEWLAEENLEFDYTPANPESDLPHDVYRMPFRTENCKFVISVFIHEKHEFIMVCGYPEFTVPVKAVSRALQPINKLNRSYRFVTIVVDPEDGELCFKGGMDYEGGTLGRQSVMGLVMGVARAIDEDLPEIIKAIYAD